MGRDVLTQDLDIWTEQVGAGPDVLLIGGLGDTVESWQLQLDGLSDRYRMTAFDNRGAGRTRWPARPFTIEEMADDAAEVLRGVRVGSAHVAAFSGGSIIAQELALRHPDLVRSLVLQGTWAAPDAYLRRWLQSVRWLVEVAPSEPQLLQAFLLWVYTPRAHNEGMVDELIDDMVAFPHKQSLEGFQGFVDAMLRHDTTTRLARISVPTLVLAGGLDLIARPDLGRAVAEAIPGARFQVLDQEAHQPFQEVPEQWNALVDSFWREVDAVG